MRRTETEKFLETVGGLRCPCGHLHDRHRKGRGEGHPIPTAIEVTGACRDCDCKGQVELIWDEEYDAA